LLSLLSPQFFHLAAGLHACDLLVLSAHATGRAPHINNTAEHCCFLTCTFYTGRCAQP
jgi:hypothetical protein